MKGDEKEARGVSRTMERGTHKQNRLNSGSGSVPHSAKAKVLSKRYAKEVPNWFKFENGRIFPADFPHGVKILCSLHFFGENF